MSDIIKIKAREILDSRGNPTVEVDLHTNEFITRASVPSGASTGVHEALELRDKNKRYLGKGVQKAVNNIALVAPKLNGLDVTQQRFIDNLLKTIDGTPNKSKLGANAILAISMAVCKAGAKATGVPLYRHVQYLAENKHLAVPSAYFNVINGGAHAGNSLDLQEYMIVPSAKSFKDILRIASEVYHRLKKIIEEKYGPGATAVGDEGGFAPPLKDNEEPLKLITLAIKQAGYENQVKIALDCAASEFYKDNRYHLGAKHNKKGQQLSAAELSNFYLKLIDKYPIFSIEDPFAQDDWEAWQRFMKLTKVQIVGDDLLVSNTVRIKTALEKEACNSLLLKVNQIGTVSEAIDAAKLALVNDWSVIVSHRSGETEDTFIADFAVGLGCRNIKSGAPCRGERTAKYNQILRIEEEILSMN